MKYPFFLQNWLTIVCSLFFLACNNESGEQSKVPVSDEQEVAQRPELLSISGNYHYLLCPKDSFYNLNLGPGNGNGRGALVLKHQITDSGLTVHGWTYKVPPNNGYFSSSPNIKFSVAAETSVTYQSGSYFSVMTISKRDIERVKDSIRKYPAMLFVGLEPKYLPSNPNEIIYKIFLTDNAKILVGSPNFRKLDMDYGFNPMPPAGGEAINN